MATIYIRPDTPLPKRRELDFYPTPPGAVRDALDLVARDGFTPTRILDPGAGEGRWGEIARTRWPEAHLTGVELRDVTPAPVYDQWHAGAFQGALGALSGPYDLVMGNPPYREAEAFVRAGLDLLDDGGRLVFLLQLAFLGAEGRGRGLWRKHPPRWVGVCSRRPAFTGSSPPSECAVYVWEQGFTGRPTLYWLPLPRAARDPRGRSRRYATNADRQAAYRRRRDASP